MKAAKLKCKSNGAITLNWTEWPNGKPQVKLTTGAAIATDTMQPVRKSASVRAFVHITAPITSGQRMYSEVSAGDAIVDFPLDLLRITDAGDTSLTIGQIVDEITFSQTNGTVESSALGDTVEPSDLEDVTMQFQGYTWAQKSIGEQLAMNWDVYTNGLNLSRSFLMCKI